MPSEVEVRTDRDTSAKFGGAAKGGEPRRPVDDPAAAGIPAQYLLADDLEW